MVKSITTYANQWRYQEDWVLGVKGWQGRLLIKWNLTSYLVFVRFDHYKHFFFTATFLRMARKLETVTIIFVQFTQHILKRSVFWESLIIKLQFIFSKKIHRRICDPLFSMSMNFSDLSGHIVSKVQFTTFFGGKNRVIWRKQRSTKAAGNS